MDCAYLCDIREMGKKRANPYAQPTNFFKLPANLNSQGCCKTPLPTCQQIITIPNASSAKIVRITYNDETIDVRDPLYTPKPKNYITGPTSDFQKLLKDPVREGLKGNDEKELMSYFFQVYQRYELDPYCGIEYDEDSDILSIKHIGQCPLNSVEVLDPADPTCKTLLPPIESVECCDIKDVTKYRLWVVGSTGPVIVDGVTVKNTLGNFPYTGGSSDQSTLDAAIAALETCLTGAGLEVVEITGILNSIGAYQLDFSIEGRTDTSVGGKSAEFCGCFEIFKCD